MCMYTIYYLWRQVPASITIVPYFGLKGRSLILWVTLRVAFSFRRPFASAPAYVSFKAFMAVVAVVVVVIVKASSDLRQLVGSVSQL